MQAMRDRAGAPSVGPVHVAISKRFAFPLRAGYEYISDLGRWPEYWPNLIRLDPESRWSQPGDTARLTLRLLGRPTELVMTLSRIVPYRLVEYTSEQGGVPALLQVRRNVLRLILEIEQLVAPYGDVGFVAVLLPEQPFEHPGSFEFVLRDQGRALGEESHDGIRLCQCPAVCEAHCGDLARWVQNQKRGLTSFSRADVDFSPVMVDV